MQQQLAATDKAADKAAVAGARWTAAKKAAAKKAAAEEAAAEEASAEKAPTEKAATKKASAEKAAAEKAAIEKAPEMDWRIRVRKGAAIDEQAAKACGQCVGARRACRQDGAWRSQLENGKGTSGIGESMEVECSQTADAGSV